MSGRRHVWRSAIAATLVFMAGLAVTHVATDGFSAYTLESARRRRFPILRSNSPMAARHSFMNYPARCCWWISSIPAA